MIVAKAALFEWINKVIGTGKSDAFWILSSVTATSTYKLKLYNEYFNDRIYTKSPADPYTYDGLVYFMGSTFGLFEEQIDEYTLYLKGNNIVYEFIAPSFDARTSKWMWEFAGGPHVRDVVERFPSRKPENKAEAMSGKDHGKGGKDHGKGKGRGGRGGGGRGGGGRGYVTVAS